MSKFSLPVQFIKPIFKADRSVKLEFETRELNGDDIAILADSRQTEGWLVYSSDNDITEADIPDEKPDPMLGTKSPSQRFRDRLYVYYREVKKGDKAKFNEWYASQLEHLGNQYLEKVND